MPPYLFLTKIGSSTNLAWWHNASYFPMHPHWLWTASNHPYPPLQSRRCTSVKLSNNILQMVAWESIFFNQAVACVEMTRLWAVLVNCWLSPRYNFDGFWAWKKRRISVAVTVQSRRRYGAIASPLRCNRVAVTVKWHHRYGAIATRLQCNGKNFWPITDRRHCQRAEGYPFSALNAPVLKC